MRYRRAIKIVPVSQSVDGFRQLRTVRIFGQKTLCTSLDALEDSGVVGYSRHNQLSHTVIRQRNMTNQIKNFETNLVYAYHQNVDAVTLQMIYQSKSIVQYYRRFEIRIGIQIMSERLCRYHMVIYYSNLYHIPNFFKCSFQSQHGVLCRSSVSSAVFRN